MTESAERHDTPKCPSCGELMITPAGTFLCITALVESYQEDGGAWHRVEGSEHPLLPEEIAYLDEHGAYQQFI